MSQPLMAVSVCTTTWKALYGNACGSQAYEAVWPARVLSKCCPVLFVPTVHSLPAVPVAQTCLAGCRYWGAHDR